MSSVFYIIGIIAAFLLGMVAGFISTIIWSRKKNNSMGQNENDGVVVFKVGRDVVNDLAKEKKVNDKYN